MFHENNYLIQKYVTLKSCVRSLCMLLGVVVEAVTTVTRCVEDVQAFLDLHILIFEILRTCLKKILP